MQVSASQVRRKGGTDAADSERAGPKGADRKFATGGDSRQPLKDM